MNLQSKHPGAEEILRNNGFSVSRSQIPSYINYVDITKEQTFNRHANVPAEKWVIADISGHMKDGELADMNVLSLWR